MLVSCLAYSLTLKMEAACSSEMSVDFQRTTRRDIPEDIRRNSQRCENLNSYIAEFQFSAVGIATGYRLDSREVGVRVPVVSRIFFSPRRPDRLCGPPSLISNGHRALSPG
jgi:hypothetical protein